MAAALLERNCGELGLDLVVASAGVQAHDLPVDPDAVTAMAELGLDISAHRPRALSRDLLVASGLVITMTRDHLRTVATTVPGMLRRSFTAKELARRLTTLETIDLDQLNAGRSARDLMSNEPADDVADPYGQSLQLHRHCAAELDEAMQVIAHALAGLT